MGFFLSFFCPLMRSTYNISEEEKLILAFYVMLRFKAVALLLFEGSTTILCYT